MRRQLVVLAAAASVQCTYRLPPRSPLVSRAPRHLSETGLYAAPDVVAADVVPYTPAFELWSDGATKQRWIQLPGPARIDTSNIDDWQFPVGTKLWKEFRIGGRRVETRLLARVALGDDGWLAVAYVWRADQRDADARPDGEADAAATGHDVPPARACMTCHGGRRSRVLGFSAIQLAHAPHGDADATLARLADAGRLSAPPPRTELAPTGSSVAAAALGYLHANCASCHNADRPPGARYFEPPGSLDLWLRVATLDDLAHTPAYRTTRDRLDELVARMSSARPFRRRMPPTATSHVDPGGIALLRAWSTER